MDEDEDEPPLKRAALEAHKRLLEQVSRLHPISVAVLQLADLLVDEVVDETVQALGREHAAAPDPLPRPSRELLEGWTAEQAAEAAASVPLRQLLEVEVEALAQRAGSNGVDTTSASEDVFGNRPKQTSDTVLCANCATYVSANRFAPHLERCMMGRGRASARAARDNMRATAES